MKKDYYDVLGVSKNASESEIKSAYRKLVKKHHPDVSKEHDAAEKFKEVQEAYQVLSNAQQRSNYDRFGNQDYNNSGFRSGFEGGFQGFNQDFSFSDIFDDFFGERKNKNNTNKYKVKDQNIEIVIDFLDACLGKEIEFQNKFEEDCKQCNGTGANNYQDIKTCNHCNGEGYITEYQNTFLGKIGTQKVCRNCSGQGKTIIKKCSFCKGLQRVSNIKTIKVSIPAGIENGMTMQLEKQGHGKHLNSENSDLYITIKIRPHDIFEREKQNILSTFYIDFYDAVLGKTINIPTIYGEVELKIPEGTQTHTKFKLKNKGIPYLHSSYRKGDHYVMVKIKTPRLSNKQKELLKQMKELDALF
ncbi:MAG: molecular chaperone DnaJ [Phytoplasma sp.]|uniref:molecular chaperone DnaJ n=1 Tax=Phytoplasma sp. TaxID=2155 RepID=UPI002B402639|nr:molecular chaperone DnaJ [Phytoplasma sp.]WRH06868.1 MAG: molecular chaperone DnaJ [Phytoplasma sp.]